MLRFIESRDFNFGTMLSYTATIYQRQFSLLLLLVFIFRAAVNIPQASVGDLDPYDPAVMDWLVENWRGVALWALLSFLTLIVLQLATIKVTVSTVHKEEIGLAAVFRRVFANFLPAILLQIILALIIVATVILPLLLLSSFGQSPLRLLSLLPPIAALIIGVYLIFSLQALAVAGYNVIDSLSRSWRAVRGQWWRVFGYALGLGAIVALANFIIQFLLRLIPYVGDLFALFATDALGVFSIIGLTLFFIHLNHRLAD